MAVYTTIDNPELYFQSVLWTGTGSSNAITLGGSEDMSPNLVWGKSRSNATSPAIHDSVRGATEEIYTSSNAAEGDYNETLKSFDSDGFTVGTDNGWNGSSRTFVAWCWKAGTTSGISGSPSITPAGYSFNADSGFSIVKWTGTGANATIPHGLGTASIGMVIIKNLDGGHWAVYHHKNTSAPETDYLKLSTNAATTDDNTWWNDTAPTSTLVNLGSYDEVNKNTENMVAYIFAEKQGYSKFGSYEGNGNADGPFVYTGFRPAWLMVKPIDAADNWVNFDNKRLGFNSSVSPYSLHANKNFVETTDTGQLDFLSNGFKIRNSGNTVNRASTFVGIAFAEAPFVNSNGVPCNAR